MFYPHFQFVHCKQALTHTYTHWQTQTMIRASAQMNKNRQIKAGATELHIGYSHTTKYETSNDVE